jgi:LacI family transcriptional regulator
MKTPKDAQSRNAAPAARARVTRNDVAELAKVAPSTVSYVVNNGPRPVSLKAKERVLKAIVKLGYHPSDVARSLRTSKSLTIGLVIPDIMNPFYGEMAKTVEEVSFQHGYTVILAHSGHSPEQELRYARVLFSKQVDGVVFLPVTPDLEPVHFLQRAGIHVVVLERIVPGYACIVADEHRAGYLAARHLLDLGHRSIGCIVLAGDSTGSVARADGYRAALREAGITPDRRWVLDSDYGYTAGAVAASRYLKLAKRPTAVVAHNDLIAIGAMKAFAEAGLQVPADISVVGCDDIAAASYVQPSLTTIAYPKRQMGKAAVEMLMGQLNGNGDAPGTLILGVELVVRGSTGPPRI